jgi:Na+-transporting NADH:ubiquinone oxidoreductase subunit A
MFGWIKPFRAKKFSISHTYFSWLTPKKSYELDTNTNGAERAFVMTGVYEKVLPMDIYPTYLLKAILAEDIDNMEALGIYEVIEEDLALCEFVCPSKIDVQEIVSNGIDLMIKEMS